MNAASNKETKGRAVAGRRRFQPTARDLAIVAGVDSAGVAMRQQVQALFFAAGGRSRSAERLRLLYRNRFLDRLGGRGGPAPPTSTASSRRCSSGLRYLRATTGEAASLRSCSPARLQHQLDIVSCRVQLTLASQAAGFLLLRWLGEEELLLLVLASGILPDAFLHLARLTDQGERHSAFFLEVERSDKSDRVSRKLRRLGEYLYGGSYEQRFGLKTLRVLFLVGDSYGIRPERRIEKLCAFAAELEVTFLRFAPLRAFLGAAPRDVLLAPLWRQPGSTTSSALFAPAAGAKARPWAAHAIPRSRRCDGPKSAPLLWSVTSARAATTDAPAWPSRRDAPAAARPPAATRVDRRPGAPA